MGARVSIAANSQNYNDFLRSKMATVPTVGFEVERERINSKLFPYQADSVEVALSKGRYALFQECGMGKTWQEVEFARLVYEESRERVLTVAPLAVADQTIDEARKLGVDVAYCRSQQEADKASTPLIITNYEMIEEFDPARFAGVVLDESGILKSFTGATKQRLISMFAETPYRLAATATPAPNDHLELGNHAEFLGIMPSNEMIMRWFLNDTMRAGHYRLKKHAENDFWDWVTSWAVCLSRPSDLGYSDQGFELPALEYLQHLIEYDHEAHWQRQVEEKTKQAKKGNGRANLGKSNFGQLELIPQGVSSATSMWKDKGFTLESRCHKVIEILDTDQINPWIVWCDTNAEADLLLKLVGAQGWAADTVEVRGSDKLAEKRRKLTAFSRGEARIIITKADIAGFGLNWQHCYQQVSAGLNFSYESLHQRVRRSYRFGQTHPVKYHMVVSETDNNILAAIQRKQAAFEEMQRKMNAAQKKHGLFNRASGRIELTDYNPQVEMSLPEWLYPHSELARFEEVA